MITTKKERRLRRAVKTRAHIRTLGVARLTIHRSAQHIPVHRRHTVHPPVLRVLANEPVDLRQPVARDAKQVVGKSAHFFLHVRPLRPKRLPDKLRRLLPHVRLKEHLQNQFAGFASSTHVRCQVSVFRRQERPRNAHT